MFRDGGKLYWGRNGIGKFKGIVVLFSLTSIPERNLKNYVDLYSSRGWESLVCHADFLNSFFPDKATSLAFVVLSELVEELRVKPRPVVFAAFSGGPKSCMYKIFKIIEGTCEAQLHMDDNRLLQNCICGHIYDSSPVDFTSDLGARFALHPTILKMPGPSKLVSWLGRSVASGLDSLCLTSFESQRFEYWQALYSSVNLGAPYLMLCSRNDDLAPYQIICNFTQRLRDLGGDVTLVKWDGASHADHYKHHPGEYNVAVTKFLERSASVYTQRIQQLEEKTGLKLICDLQNVAVNSNQSFRRVAVGPSDHFFLPSSLYHHNTTSDPDPLNQRSTNLSNPPSISAHTVLGQILFDVCVPKNIEGWDIKFCGSLNGQPFGSVRRLSPSNAVKSIRRSRL